MKRWPLVLLTLVVSLTISAEAQAQWQSGNLALKTNGNLFQSGDQIKVEVLALETITESFFTQVSYKFTETVTEKDEDGKEQTTQKPRTRARPPGPVLESMEQFRSLVLDDTFHFGEGNPTGQYEIEVAIFRPYTKEKVATLRTCVFFQESPHRQRTCPTYLHSLKRVQTDSWFTFDGQFNEQGRYSLVLLNRNQVVKSINVGVYTTGPNELHISSQFLGEAPGRTLDILLHDHSTNYSTSLARVTVPTAP